MSRVRKKMCKSIVTIHRDMARQEYKKILKEQAKKEKEGLANICSNVADVSVQP